MTKFRFEIQNCITVEVEGDNKEDARLWLVDNTDQYADQMVGGGCYISDGEEID